MKDFFISHASADKKHIVAPLVRALEKSGFSVWYDNDNILAGNNIYESISIGLKESYCLILIITANYLSSKWTFLELGIFSQKQCRRIIPIIYDDSLITTTNALSFINNLKRINGKDKDIIQQLSNALFSTKGENEDLVLVDTLHTIMKEINNYEQNTIGSVGLKLKDYIHFLNDNFSYVAISAKRLVLQIAKDIINHYSIAQISSDADEDRLLNIIHAHNIGNINIREYFDFFLSDRVDKISLNEINTINHGLCNILRWFINVRYPFATAIKPLKIVHPEELNYEDFEEMYHIDMLVMRKDLIADIYTIYNEWYLYNNYTHLAIKDISTNKIIGYCAILPITDDTYNKILNGDFKDKDFDRNAIRQYDLPSDTYKLYVAGFAINPSYYNTNAFTSLYNAIIDLLVYLAKEREIYVSEIIAEASTKQGEKFCRILNMQKRVHTIFDTDVFTLDLIPPEFRINNIQSKLLYKIMMQKYEENRRIFG